MAALMIKPQTAKFIISLLAVLPQYQGQGIAQQALSVIENLHKDVDRWFLDTILQEPGNCHLYEKLGYRRSGKIEIINDKMTLVFYEKGYNIMEVIWRT